MVNRDSFSLSPLSTQFFSPSASVWFRFVQSYHRPGNPIYGKEMWILFPRLAPTKPVHLQLTQILRGRMTSKESYSRTMPSLLVMRHKDWQPRIRKDDRITIFSMPAYVTKCRENQTQYYCLNLSEILDTKNLKETCSKLATFGNYKSSPIHVKWVNLLVQYISMVNDNPQ